MEVIHLMILFYLIFFFFFLIFFFLVCHRQHTKHNVFVQDAKNNVDADLVMLEELKVKCRAQTEQIMAWKKAYSMQVIELRDSFYLWHVSHGVKGGKMQKNVKLCLDIALVLVDEAQLLEIFSESFSGQG